MTFQELYDEIGKLTPEQRQQEILFVKHGACSNYNWSDIPENGYCEDSSRLSLEVADGGAVYWQEGEFENGIPDCDYDVLMDTSCEDDVLEEIVPEGMPFFCISE